MILALTGAALGTAVALAAVDSRSHGAALSVAVAADDRRELASLAFTLAIAIFAGLLVGSCRRCAPPQAR
jgi:hypothetical protein